MNLRVKVNTVALPHVVTNKKITYVFRPDAEVPDEYGKALLKTYPNMFEEAKGEPDLSKYQVKSENKKKLLLDAINGLSEDKHLRVLEFIMNLQNESTKTPAADPLDSVELTEDGLDALKVPELKKLAEKLNIDLEAAKSKSEIIDQILKVTASR